MGFNTRIHARIDSELKEAAGKVFQSLGITEGEAIRLFYAQVRLHQGLPFRVNIPTPETEEALREGENPDSLPAYNRFSDLRKELGI